MQSRHTKADRPGSLTSYAFVPSAELEMFRRLFKVTQQSAVA